MRAADLENARLIAAARDTNRAMRDRLAAEEKLSLTVGEGGTASGIVLAPSYIARIRADIIAALDLRIAENEAALVALGVEP